MIGFSSRAEYRARIGHGLSTCCKRIESLRTGQRLPNTGHLFLDDLEYNLTMPSIASIVDSAKIDSAGVRVVLGGFSGGLAGLIAVSVADSVFLIALLAGILTGIFFVILANGYHAFSKNGD
jgi:hypothetical protein